MTDIARHISCAGAPLRRRHSLFSTLAHVYGVWRQRQVLKTLDAERLSDLGLTRDQAQTEARRPLWDAPRTWRV